MAKSTKTVPVTPTASIDDNDQTLQVVKLVPRPDPFKKSAKERALAGVYRVIHGNIFAPRPASELRNPDGTEKVGVSKLRMLIPGDEVRLGNEDAARMLDADIVEPIDARPSRVGKVWTPPKPIKNRNTAPSANVG